MASLVIFHYQPGDTPIHRLDARFKLPLFLLIVAVALHAGPFGLLLLCAATAAAVAAARLPARRILRELRLFLLLLILMFVARSAGESGGAGGQFSAESIGAAGLLVWRLILLVVLGTLLAATARAAHLQSAVAWFLRPFRFLPGGRVATMVGLTISLIPLIFDTYREVSEAQAARCAHGLRKPVRRLRRLVVPLMLKTFGRADDLAAAMESRCYSDDRAFARLHAAGSDWMGAAIVVAFAAASLALDRLL